METRSNSLPKNYETDFSNQTLQIKDAKQLLKSLMNEMATVGLHRGVLRVIDTLHDEPGFQKAINKNSEYRNRFNAINEHVIETLAEGRYARSKQLFLNIPKEELVNLASNDINQKRAFTETIQDFNLSSSLIVSDIIDIESRLKNIESSKQTIRNDLKSMRALSRWIAVLDKCLEKPDYHGTNIVNSAFSHISLMNLIEHLPDNEKAILKKASILFGSKGNFKNLRDAMEKSPFRIPYLGLFKQDFVGFHENFALKKEEELETFLKKNHRTPTDEECKIISNKIKKNELESKSEFVKPIIALQELIKQDYTPDSQCYLWEHAEQSVFNIMEIVQSYNNGIKENDDKIYKLEGVSGQPTSDALQKYMDTIQNYNEGKVTRTQLLSTLISKSFNGAEFGDFTSEGQYEINRITSEIKQEIPDEIEKKLAERQLTDTSKQANELPKDYYQKLSDKSKELLMDYANKYKVSSDPLHKSRSDLINDIINALQNIPTIKQQIDILNDALSQIPSNITSRYYDLHQHHSNLKGYLKKLMNTDTTAVQLLTDYRDTLMLMSKQQTPPPATTTKTKTIDLETANTSTKMIFSTQNTTELQPAKPTLEQIQTLVPELAKNEQAMTPAPGTFKSKGNVERKNTQRLITFYENLTDQAKREKEKFTIKKEEPQVPTKKP